MSNQKYLIIDGDEIKKGCEKSVDCIIIDLNENNESEFRIILCELTKGTKELKEGLKNLNPAEN